MLAIHPVQEDLQTLYHFELLSVPRAIFLDESVDHRVHLVAMPIDHRIDLAGVALALGLELSVVLIALGLQLLVVAGALASQVSIELHGGPRGSGRQGSDRSVYFRADLLDHASQLRVMLPRTV